MKRPLRFLAGCAIFLFFVWAAGRAADQELASGGVLTGRAEVGGVEGASAKPGGIGNGIAGQEVGLAASARSVSACGASSIGPDGRVTVTSCGERLSERVAEVGRQSTTPRGGSWPRPTAIDATRSENLYQGKQASIRAIRKVFGRRAGPAIRVASCETGGTFYARAVSRTGDYGLFQANYRAHHWRGESTAAFARRHFNLAYHVPWAYKLSRGGTNWGPWACRWAA